MARWLAARIGPAATVLDLLVDLERGCSLLEVIALRQELEALLNCQVDLAEAAQLHPLIRDQVIAQATAL